MQHTAPECTNQSHALSASSRHHFNLDTTNRRIWKDFKLDIGECLNCGSTLAMPNADHANYVPESVALWDSLPSNITGPLGRYFEYRRAPGSFLTAFLESDRYWTSFEVDHRVTGALSSWLAQFAPANSYGSRELVHAWLGGAAV